MLSVANCGTACLKQLEIFPFPNSSANFLGDLCVIGKELLNVIASLHIFWFIASYTYLCTVVFVLTILFAIKICDADLVYIVLFWCCKHFCTRPN